MRLAGLLLLSTVFSVGLHAEDRYWKIDARDQGIKKGQKNIIRSLPVAAFWKTRSSGASTEVFEICKGVGSLETKLGDAKGTPETGWTLPAGDDTMNIKIESTGKNAGKLAITHKDGRLWATGYRVEPVTCDPQTGLPRDMKRWVGKENVFAAESAKTLKDKLIAELTETGVEFDENASEAELKKIALTSGMHHLESSRDGLLQVLRPVTPTPGKPATSQKVPTGTLMCKTAPMTEKSVRDLTDSPALAINTQIYPGNLLRGKQFSEGKFTSVGVKNGRSGGKLTILGLNFDPADSPQYSIDVDKITLANVTQKIKELTSQKVLSTESTSTFNAQQVYSQDQLAFAMGVDGRFTNVSFSAAMNIDTNAKKNYVLARFTQIYYTIDFEDPEDSYAVFADGDKFEDRDRIVGAFNKDGTINRDVSNPILYVKTVSYGRQIYFLASSTESSTAVQAALEGAYGNKEAGNYIAANASMTYESVMKNTEVAYFTLGGNSVAAVQPIKAKTPSEMYNAVKEFIADAESAQFGPESQGMPIAYSLNYLTSQDRASLGYATSYDQTNCEVVPTGYFSFIVEFTCIDDEATVSISNPSTNQEEVAYQSGRPSNVPLDLFMDDKEKTHTLRIKDYNIAGGWCAHYRIKRQRMADPTYRKDLYDKDKNAMEVMYLTPENSFSEVPTVFYNSGGALVGTNHNAEIRVNRATGLAQIIKQ